MSLILSMTYSSISGGSARRRRTVTNSLGTEPVRLPVSATRSVVALQPKQRVKRTLPYRNVGQPGMSVACEIVDFGKMPELRHFTCLLHSRSDSHPLPPEIKWGCQSWRAGNPCFDGCNDNRNRASPTGGDISPLPGARTPHGPGAAWTESSSTRERASAILTWRDF
jgi:hypothetical protein